MKMSFFNFLNLSLILLLASFNKILNESCSDASLTGTEDEQIQKCFSFSTMSDETLNKCCFTRGDTSNPNKCNPSIGTVCPDETKVPNNCGMAGIFKPLTADLCKEISLVQGYCCYVKLKKDSTESASCIRTKKLNKNKNEATDQIKKYVGDEYTIESVECHGENLKYYWLIIISIIMLL